MDYPMRDDLQVGARFPDIELPDPEGERHRLSDLLGDYPGILVFYRGHY